MAGFFQDLLKGAADSLFGNPYLRDYTHASKTFTTNSYQNAPKFKFLFHVYFDIDPSIYAVSKNIGLEVKSVKLPSYNFTTHEMNQYNRKRIVQTKIKYDDIEINFHDDNGNTIRNMWYAYYTYYYADATKVQGGSTRLAASNSINPAPTYSERTQYKPSITGSDDWGYIGDSQGSIKKPFFRTITVFGFNQHNYAAYTLINPIISRFGHDTYDYAQGNGTMENKMSIAYETVKYYDGAMDGMTPEGKVTGFGDIANYDRRLSPISRPGSNGKILGQGGLVDAAGGVLGDLSSGNILGAVLKGGTLAYDLKGVNLKAQIQSEVTGAVIGAVVAQAPGRAIAANFPTFGATNNTTPAGRAGVPNSGLSAPVQIPDGAGQR